jgi:hypothetical protein
MRTEYIFDVADGGLVSSTKTEGCQVLIRVYRNDPDVKHLTSIIVCEKYIAEREFFNHFGDDSSWPPGWWAKLTADKFTRLSWQRENYPDSKVSRQEFPAESYRWPFGKTQT